MMKIVAGSEAQEIDMDDFTGIVTSTPSWENVSPDDLSQYSDRVFGSFRKHAAYYEDLRKEFAGGI